MFRFSFAIVLILAASFAGAQEIGIRPGGFTLDVLTTSSSVTYRLLAVNDAGTTATGPSVVGTGAVQKLRVKAFGHCLVYVSERTGGVTVRRFIGEGTPMDILIKLIAEENPDRLALFIAACEAEGINLNKLRKAVETYLAACQAALLAQETSDSAKRVDEIQTKYIVVD